MAFAELSFDTLHKNLTTSLQLPENPVDIQTVEYLNELIDGVKHLNKSIEQSTRRIEKNRAHIKNSQDTIKKGDDAIALLTEQYERKRQKFEQEKELVDATLKLWRQNLPRNPELMQEIVKQDESFIPLLQ